MLTNFTESDEKKFSRLRNKTFISEKVALGPFLYLGIGTSSLELELGMELEVKVPIDHMELMAFAVSFPMELIPQTPLVP